jgi:siroheme synthase
MSPIRILIADPNDRLQPVVHRAIADQPDLVTIENGNGEVDLMLRAEAADAVIVTMAGEDLPPIAERLIDEYAHVGVVAIDINRNQGVVVQPRPQPVKIGELSPPTLGAAIRLAAKRLTHCAESLQRGDTT